MAKRLILRIGFLALFFFIYPLAKTENLPPQLLVEMYGTDTLGRFGRSVAGIGDIDGDGEPDFMVGANGVSTGGLGLQGRVNVYSGYGLLLYKIDGNNSGMQLGVSASGTGDVNGDGTPDFIVGTPVSYAGGPSASGSAFVYSGPNGTLITQKNGTKVDQGLGISVAGVGDLNADGRNDYIIGASGASPGGLIQAGSAYVYSGATGSLIYQKDGEDSANFLGGSVSGAGDVDGDGTPDFIIGASRAFSGELTQTGSAYVYSGATGSLLYRKDGAAAGDRFGMRVAGVGDVNADGKADFIIGAYEADPDGRSNAGSAYLYSGATGGLLYQIDGSAPGAQFGTVSGVGDVDENGTPDFIIGARLASPGGRTEAGSVFVYSGATGFLIFQIDGDSALDNLGFSVGGVGDVNGDGRDDIIAGAPSANRNGLSSAGLAYVYGLVSTDAPDEKSNWPGQFELSQNYPNPFNATTTIRYSLNKREKVTLEIFNLLGERVRVLIDEEQTAGEHTAFWDGKDEKGKALSSGIYFYRLKGKDFSETRKMLLLK